MRMQLFVSFLVYSNLKDTERVLLLRRSTTQPHHDGIPLASNPPWRETQCICYVNDGVQALTAATGFMR